MKRSSPFRCRTLPAVPIPRSPYPIRPATIFSASRLCVDGKLVELQAEQRAFLLAPGKPEVEITGRLKSLHIPLVPMQEAAGAALAALRAPECKALIDAGVILDLGEGKGDYKIWFRSGRCARNSGATRFFLRAGTLFVEQTYTPGTGSQSTLSFGAPDLSAAERARYRKTYCTDAPFTKAAQTSVPRGERSAPEGAGVRTISPPYVITSGGNWAGPIGTFRLTVNKGDPKTLVSFCGDDVRKTGPSTFEMVARIISPGAISTCSLSPCRLNARRLSPLVALTGSGPDRHQSILTPFAFAAASANLRVCVKASLSELQSGVGDFREARRDHLRRPLASVRDRRPAISSICVTAKTPPPAPRMTREGAFSPTRNRTPGVTASGASSSAASGGRQALRHLACAQWGRAC